eukprot:TRINITY_DN5620_c0_g2_i1.p1 TRINITY_DN5620_c0_g2~~TRINITY_DN5620_c0_g2_i1.p1  ORF type:complete len:738 (-),score=161.03 TRINITY_DN5620_c0_g2_i1:111-2021(-)
MKVFTASEKTKKAREGVMEFLLANHPLDCPICDQGGECDLQDQSMVYGADRSRFTEYKRSVEDKNIGPLVKTVMTRCIHCTRCVRFATEVAGVQDLGMTGRGAESQIGTYVEKMFGSELSGNIVDLCPVGALTSKPYAFTARSWELTRFESIDVHDAIGTNISVDVRSGEVMRVLPRLHEEVNEEWLADKGRYSYDGLRRQRLQTPIVKLPSGEYRSVSWQDAFETIKRQLRGVAGSNISAMAGGLADAESVIVLKDLLNRLGCENLECREDGAKVNPDVRSNYLLNSTIQKAEEADVVLLVGVNPRQEAPLFNTRLRKAYLYNAALVCNIGPAANLTYNTRQLGDNISVLEDIANGKHPLAQLLAEAKRPMIVIGQSALQRGDAEAVMNGVRAIAQKAPLIQEGWNGINILQQTAGRSAALDLGFVPGAGATSGQADGRRVLYKLNADDTREVSRDTFVIYQGHHGDEGAQSADVILPGCAYTEKEATYVNAEGRVQRTKRAVFPPGDAREDWKIIRALADVLDVPLSYDTVDGVRARLADVAPQFAELDNLQPTTFQQPTLNSSKQAALNTSQSVTSGYANYYMTDPISRASVIMARCTTQAPADLVAKKDLAAAAQSLARSTETTSARAVSYA